MKREGVENAIDAEAQRTQRNQKPLLRFRLMPFLRVLCASASSALKEFRRVASAEFSGRATRIATAEFFGCASRIASAEFFGHATRVAKAEFSCRTQYPEAS